VTEIDIGELPIWPNYRHFSEFAAGFGAALREHCSCQENEDEKAKLPETAGGARWETHRSCDFVDILSPGEISTFQRRNRMKTED
jgi:hypothetical protein